MLSIIYYLHMPRCEIDSLGIPGGKHASQKSKPRIIGYRSPDRAQMSEPTSRPWRTARIAIPRGIAESPHRSAFQEGMTFTRADNCLLCYCLSSPVANFYDVAIKRLGRNPERKSGRWFLIKVIKSFPSWGGDDFWGQTRIKLRRGIDRE